MDGSMDNIDVKIRINGKEYESSVEPRLLLVHFIRDNASLTGTHIGCDTSDCGACTVLMDGKPVKSCTLFAFQANGHDITTIEGVSGKGIELQDAFVKDNGLQCGFCTPGMILEAKYLLETNPNADEKEIREGLNGNLCRCTGYAGIIKAIKRVQKDKK